MEPLCATRAVKVLKYLHSMVPTTVPRSSLDAFESLPSSVLARIHITSDWDEVTEDAQLRNWLAKNPIPSPGASVSGPLFHGTLVFVQLIFQQPSKPPSSVSMTDVQTAVNYATVAVVPIERYASQYGTNSVSVSPTVIPFTANLTSDSFTQSQFEDWVDQCAQTAHNNNVSNPCIVILHNRDLPNSARFSGHRDSYHHMTGNGTPYCYSLVFGQNLSIADNNHTNHGIPNDKVYAHNLSHEIAEMVVDPGNGVSNPEVCDACFGNCSNPQFDLFDQNGVFMGGTADTASASGFAFFITSVVRPELYDPSTECLIPGADKRDGCIYPPPVSWNGPALLAKVGQIVGVAGHFATADRRNVVLVGIRGDRVHEIYWHPAQVGIEGQDDLPVPFAAGSIVSVASLYNSDQQRHVALAGTRQGTVREIYWKSDTAGVEGFDDLPVTFTPGTIVAVSALYNPDDQRHVVVVGTTAGKVHEIFWKADTVGVEGHDDLPVTFAPGSIAGVSAFYNRDDHRHVVVVGTAAGKVHEIFWKADTVGVEGHDDLPVTFAPGSIAGVSGFYDSAKQRHVVAVGLTDGTVHQIYWKTAQVGVEAHSVVAQFQAGTIVRIAGYFSESDLAEHIIVGLSDGSVEELWTVPDV